MSDPNLTFYFQNMKNLERKSKRVMTSLFRDYYVTRDPWLERRLWELNLPLVPVILKIQGHGMDLDLIQDCNIGLLRAVQKYDPFRKPFIQFSTYAAWWIKAMQSKNFKRFIKHVDEDLGDDWFHTIPGPDAVEAYETSDHRRQLWKMIGKLRKAEREILEGRLIHEKKLEDIGNVIGVSRERIRQVELQATKKLFVLAGVPFQETEKQRKARLRKEAKAAA